MMIKSIKRFALLKECKKNRNVKKFKIYSDEL